MDGTESTTLRVLIAEDSEDDALLIGRHLRRGGYEPLIKRVDSARGMQAALDEHSWDLIITDHNMPGFDSLEALQLAKKHDPNLPFIMVSGSIGEEIAVDVMKSGAHDYVMKGNLARLLPAIERELREAKNRRAHQEAEARIRHMAYHDSLTGLVNRAEFERRLENTLKEAQASDESHALLFLDLDQFKLVNDSCGHTAGDELLRRLTRRLQAGVRSSDSLARLGGDEFAILLQNCGLEQARELAQGLLESISDYRFIWENRTFRVGASAGLVSLDKDKNSQILLSMADMACYAAKERGRNRVHIFEEGDAELNQRRGEMVWLQRLQTALLHGGLLLYAQRIQGLQSANTHVELLLRLQDRDGEIITPDCFIPAAERYNLMPEIDRWVIHQVCEQLQNTATDEHEGCYFINLSALSLSEPGLMAYIREQLSSHAIPPARIGFEITETAAIADFDCALELIRSLRDYGCKVALDDFGTGMSSFSYLKNLTVDYLKIDGTFVRNMLQDKMDAAIVEAVNAIGHIAGVQTIAEFVEQDAHIGHLTRLGVDYAQGWAVDRPKPFTSGMPLQSAMN